LAALPLDAAHGLFAAFESDVGHEDPRPFPRKGQGGGPADSRSASGDQRDFPL
jgi:hypothetical protein